MAVQCKMSLWTKVDTLQTQIVSHKTEATTIHTELSKVKKTYQALEIKLQSLLSEVEHSVVRLTPVQ